MSDLRQAAQALVDALAETSQWDATDRKFAAVCNLRAALAQPEPEPVGHFQRDPNTGAWQQVSEQYSSDPDVLPLYTALAQPEPKQYPLPDDLYDSKDWRVADYAGRVEWLHGMYESKKREADSAFEMLALTPDPKAEPVAWIEVPYGANRANPLYRWTAPQSLAWSIPLYAHPPVERKPMTDAEHDALMRGKSTLDYGRAVERHHGICGEE